MSTSNFECPLKHSELQEPKVKIQVPYLTLYLWSPKGLNFVWSMIHTTLPGSQLHFTRLSFSFCYVLYNLTNLMSYFGLLEFKVFIPQLPKFPHGFALKFLGTKKKCEHKLLIKMHISPFQCSTNSLFGLEQLWLQCQRFKVKGFGQ